MNRSFTRVFENSNSYEFTIVDDPLRLMRYLTSTRTPSVRLYAYLLLFFGCATNLYTAALPVTEPDSGLAAPSASALVPRDGTLVRVEWKNDNEQATGLTSDERWNDFTMKCLQNVIETNLGKQWSDGKKVGQFLGKPMWNKWQQKDSDGDSEHPAATAYFQYLLVNSYEYGQVLAKQLQFRSEYYFTRYKSVQAEKVGEPFSISLQHTYVVRTSRRVNEQGSHAQAYKDAIVDSFNEFFGPFPSIQPTNDRQPKLGVSDVLFEGMDYVSSSGPTKFDVISSTGDLAHVQHGTIRHVGIARGKLNYKLELESAISGKSKVSTKFSISAQGRTGSAHDTSIVPPGSS